MSRNRFWMATAVTALLCAGDEPWKAKKISEWTEADAKAVISDSPWAKQSFPKIGPLPAIASRVGGVGLGGGMGRGGMGGGGGGRRGGYPPRTSSNPIEANFALTLRWESALPVRAGAARARDIAAPDVDEAHYAVAVYGVPRHMSGEDSKSYIEDLKKHAALKREGKKDLKPDTVDVQQREGGPVFVYYFSRSVEITKSDVIEFNAHIGRLIVKQPFVAAEMTYQGKLEL